MNRKTTRRLNIICFLAIILQCDYVSEGIEWDFKENAPAEFLYDYFGFDTGLIPETKGKTLEEMEDVCRK